MANESDLETLRREHEKRQAAAAETAEKISAIEAEEKRRREEKERKERELASLQDKLKKCRDWMLYTEREITKLHEYCQSGLNVACEGSGEAYSTLKMNLKEEAQSEWLLAALKEFEATLAAKIEAHGKQ